ncbi:serine/threonine-protein kinase, putative, partial [Entamoeba histolytica HM-1:IMSS-A]
PAINKEVHQTKVPLHTHTGSLGTIESTESKSKKKNYKIPTLKKVSREGSGSLMSSSEPSNSTVSTPRRRLLSLVSPRKTESPQESPRSSTKLSFLIPSFMRKRSNSPSGGSSDNEGSVQELSSTPER